MVAVSNRAEDCGEMLGAGHSLLLLESADETFLGDSPSVLLIICGAGDLYLRVHYLAACIWSTTLKEK